MSILTELNRAINELNELWPLLEGGEKFSILERRDMLNEKAAELAEKILRDGIPELTAAISALEKATQAAKNAKESIDNITERINKVADTIASVTEATVKVAGLIAVL